MLDDGEKIPVPTNMQKITLDPEFKDSFAFMCVEVHETKPKTVRVNITIPENTLKHIDLAARKKGVSRSAFLIHAAQSAISRTSLSEI